MQDTMERGKHNAHNYKLLSTRYMYIHICESHKNRIHMYSSTTDIYIEHDKYSDT